MGGIGAKQARVETGCNQPSSRRQISVPSVIVPMGVTVAILLRLLYTASTFGVPLYATSWMSYCVPVVSPVIVQVTTVLVTPGV